MANTASVFWKRWPQATQLGWLLLFLCLMSSCCHEGSDLTNSQPSIVPIYQGNLDKLPAGTLLTKPDGTQTTVQTETWVVSGVYLDRMNKLLAAAITRLDQCNCKN